MAEIFELAQRLVRDPPKPRVLATLVDVSGSSYRRAGARALFDEIGKVAGSISGGCLEDDLVARAQHLLRCHATASNATDVVVYDTTSENDLIWGVGLGCHGIVKVVLERLTRAPAWAHQVIRSAQTRVPCTIATPWPDSDGSPRIWEQPVPPPISLVVYGAGDDAQPLCRLAAGLGWEVAIGDPRPAMAAVKRFPEAAHVVSLPVEQLGAHFTGDAHAAAVIMTHHYVYDRPLLERLIKQPFGYLGLLGPRVRAERLLHEIGVDAPPHFFAPVGLDLGGDGPEAVALAILSEIQAHFEARSARPLRERNRPIHAR